MSAATSFYTTFQQMSLTLGIAISAAALAASIGRPPTGADAAGLFRRVPVRFGDLLLAAPLISLRLDTLREPR